MLKNSWFSLEFLLFIFFSSVFLFIFISPFSSSSFLQPLTSHFHFYPSCAHFPPSFVNVFFYFTRNYLPNVQKGINISAVSLFHKIKGKEDKLPFLQTHIKNVHQCMLQQRLNNKYFAVHLTTGENSNSKQTEKRKFANDVRKESVFDATVKQLNEMEVEVIFSNNNIGKIPIPPQIFKNETFITAYKRHNQNILNRKIENISEAKRKDSFFDNTKEQRNKQNETKIEEIEKIENKNEIENECRKENQEIKITEYNQVYPQQGRYYENDIKNFLLNLKIGDSVKILVRKKLLKTTEFLCSFISDKDYFERKQIEFLQKLSRLNENTAIEGKVVEYKTDQFIIYLNKFLNASLPFKYNCKKFCRNYFSDHDNAKFTVHHVSLTAHTAYLCFHSPHLLPLNYTKLQLLDTCKKLEWFSINRRFISSQILSLNKNSCLVKLFHKEEKENPSQNKDETNSIQLFGNLEIEEIYGDIIFPGMRVYTRIKSFQLLGSNQQLHIELTLRPPIKYDLSLKTTLKELVKQDSGKISEAFEMNNLQDSCFFGKVVNIVDFYAFVKVFINLGKDFLIGVIQKHKLNKYAKQNSTLLLRCVDFPSRKIKQNVVHICKEVLGTEDCKLLNAKSISFLQLAIFDDLKKHEENFKTSFNDTNLEREENEDSQNESSSRDYFNHIAKDQPPSNTTKPKAAAGKKRLLVKRKMFSHGCTAKGLGKKPGREAKRLFVPLFNEKFCYDNQDHRCFSNSTKEEIEERQKDLSDYLEAPQIYRLQRHRIIRRLIEHHSTYFNNLKLAYIEECPMLLTDELFIDEAIRNKLLFKFFLRRFLMEQNLEKVKCTLYDLEKIKSLIKETHDEIFSLKSFDEDLKNLSLKNNSVLVEAFNSTIRPDPSMEGKNALRLLNEIILKKRQKYPPDFLQVILDDIHLDEFMPLQRVPTFLEFANQPHSHDDARRFKLAARRDIYLEKFDPYSRVKKLQEKLLESMLDGPASGKHSLTLSKWITNISPEDQAYLERTAPVVNAPTL